MESALGIAVSNAIVAALIALLMTAAALILRKPALTHALGVLVLLKLLTPPIWTVPLDRRFAKTAPDRPSHSIVEAAHPIQPDQTSAVAPQFEESGHLSVAEVTRPGDAIETRIESSLSLPPTQYIQPQTQTPPPENWAVNWLAESWPLILAAAWLCGCVICAGIILLRIIRFGRLLRFATLAPPELQSRTQALARRMGVNRAPVVSLVPGAVCPMLWVLGRSARLLVPSELWDRLGERQRSSLLAHELAHLRRRDHWVRAIELIATVLYWWCPVVWYARRRLREAEEQCCDAWVIWLIPGSARDYASALLETVEFVTAGGVLSAPSMPALASGMGQFHQLKRRLVMITNECVSRNMSRGGWLMVGALGLMLLPLTPTRAQVAVTSEEPKPVAPVVEEPIPPVSPVDPAPTTATIAPSSQRGQISVTTAAPKAVQKWVIEDIKVPSDSIAVEKSIQVDGSGSFDVDPKHDPKLWEAINAARTEVKELAGQLDRAQSRLQKLEAEAGYAKRKSELKSNFEGIKAPRTATPAAVPGKINKSSDKRSAGDTYTWSDPNGSNGFKPQTDPKNRERRLDEVEANLQKLLDEVRSLRKERENAPTPKPEAPGYSKERPAR